MFCGDGSLAGFGLIRAVYLRGEHPPRSAIDFSQLPRCYELLGTRRHFAQLSCDLDLFALCRLGQAIAEMRQLFLPLTTTAKLFLSFTATHGRFSQK